MAVRVVGDRGDGGVFNIPSDDNTDIVMNVTVSPEGDFGLSLRNDKTHERLEFITRGVGGGSQNRELAVVFVKFARELIEKTQESQRH